MSLVSITTTVPTPPSFKAICERIATDILGPQYECSIVICGDYLARKMNVTYRKKTYKPNVLSFPLSDESGELFLNIRKSDREAQRYEHTAEVHRIFLLIHGLLHLKGYDHGATMENAERKYVRKYTHA